METDYNAMTEAALSFFAELEADNSKAFFDANRERFKTQIKEPADRFVDEMGAALQGITGVPVTGKLFRANRDVRFSKDKRPYNTHLHMSWTETPERPTAPVWFVGISLVYQTAGFGLFGIQGPGLTTYREMIDASGDALLAAVAASDGAISSHGPEPLKRVPAPYPKDHPHGDLLKRKGLTIDVDLEPKIAAGLNPFDAARSSFSSLVPVAAIFREHL